MIKSILKSRRKYGSFIAGSVGVTLIAASGSVFGQQPVEPVQTENTERVIVTGSNIPTAADETSQPVSIVDRQAIDQSGATTVSDLVRRIPQVVGGGNFNGTQVNNPGGGESLIALRGLPATSTLVLVNGKRFALSAGPSIGAGEAVNINDIPIGAIDRVEILREGAGPIYGSDAVAGVVNIILRDHYRGAEITAEYGNTTSKDAGQQLYTAVVGTGTDKLDIVFTASYIKNDAVFSRDRPLFETADFSRNGGFDQRSSAANPGRFTTTTGTFTLNPGLTVGGVFPDDYHTTGTLRSDRFNFNRLIQLTSEFERYGFSADTTYKIIGDALKLRLQGFYNHSSTYSVAAPTPLFTNQEAPVLVNGVPTAITVPAGNIHNPSGEDLTDVRYRFLELGTRNGETDVDTFRFQGGIEGDVLNGKVHYETGVTYSRESDNTFSSGLVNKRELFDQLQNTDPTIASVNVFGNRNANLTTPEQRAALRRISLTANDIGHYSTLQYVASAGARPFHLPGGDLGVALGFEYRREEINLRPDSAKTSSNTIGSTNAQNTAGNRTVYSGYVELKIPLTGENFHIPGVWGSELDLAFRREEFSDFGSADKPSIGGFIQPFDDSLKLRASYSQGFKAPTLGELFSGNQESFESINNPLDPTQIQALTLRSGNRDLQAENSRSYNFGFIYSPKFKYLKGLTVRADAFRITKRNNVTLLGSQTVLDQAIAGNPAFTDQVVFNPGGSVQTITDQYTNVGKSQVEGIDWGITYVIPADKFGTLTLAWDSTWIVKYQDQLSDENGGPNGPFFRLDGSTGGLGGFAAGFAIPRLRGLGSVIYDLGGFNATTNITYIGELSELNNQGGYRRLETYVKTDVQLSYTFGKPGPTAVEAAPQPPAPKDGKDGGMVAGKDKVVHEMAQGTRPHWYDGLTISVGANNIFDTSPPFEVGGFSSGSPTDLNLYDVTGRFVYGRIVKKF